MSYPLDGQLAVVTGASRGIGLGCAQALADAGARVIAIARSEPDLASVAAHDSGRIEGWAADVCSAELPARIEALDGLNILVNNAGGNRPQPFAEVDDESLDFVIDLNVRSAFRIAQAAARAMLAAKIPGRIVNMSSQMGHIGAANRTVYCMTKHAIEGLTKAMAVELAPNGIRVNAIAPTFIETPLTRPMLDDPEFLESVMDMIPLREIGSVDDVVSALMYLVSPGARMVTGHSLRVDGGWTAR
ncbi:MAG: SDR family NAD(P)-dependent oxidoreductase [Gammaproteobacteria bacterium]